MEPPNPSGLCMCGCGQKTPIAKQTSPQRGYVKGEHTCYLPSHYQNQGNFTRAPDPTPDEIQQRAAEIRARWGRREWLRAIGAEADQSQGWTAPKASILRSAQPRALRDI